MMRDRRVIVGLLAGVVTGALLVLHAGFAYWSWLDSSWRRGQVRIYPSLRNFISHNPLTADMKEGSDDRKRIAQWEKNLGPPRKLAPLTGTSFQASTGWIILCGTFRFAGGGRAPGGTSSCARMKIRSAY